jgi:hypothetical protein
MLKLKLRGVANRGVSSQKYLVARESFRQYPSPFLCVSLSQLRLESNLSSKSAVQFNSLPTSTW